MRLGTSKPASRFHLLGDTASAEHTSVEHALLSCARATRHAPIILFTRREAGRGNDDGGGAVEGGERVTFELSTDKSRGDIVTGEVNCTI